MPNIKSNQHKYLVTTHVTTFHQGSDYNSEVLNVQLKSLMANARGVGFPVQEHCVRPFPCGAIK